MTVAELRRILADNNVAGRSKYTTKAQLIVAVETVRAEARTAEIRVRIAEETKRAVERTAEIRVQIAEETKRAVELKERVRLLEKAGQLLPLHRLLRSGFKPIHKADEAEEALDYLQKLLTYVNPTKQCAGSAEYAYWFDYLSRHEQFHPTITTTDNLMFVFDEDASMLTFHTKEKTLSRIKQLVASGNDTAIPVYITFLPQSAAGHANMILINRRRRTLEWFEPHGLYKGGWIFQMKEFVEDKLSSVLGLPSDYTVSLPYEDCPMVIGPQMLQLKHSGCTIGGYCAAYSTLYAHLRFLAPDESPESTVDTLMELNRVQMLDLILRYIGWQNLLALKHNLMSTDEPNYTRKSAKWTRQDLRNWYRTHERND